MIDKDKIIKHFEEYIKEQNSNYGIWYIGQCNEPHGIILNIVKRTSSNWMYIETGSSQIAQEVMDYFVNTIGLAIENQRDSFGTGKIVYVYKKPKKI